MRRTESVENLVIGTSDGVTSKPILAKCRRTRVRAERNWVQCQKMDERLREIFSEHEDEEGFEKEGEVQFAYEEKVDVRLSAAESFLEERKESHRQ